MKKILLTGINGQVGHALQKKLVHHQVVALNREQLDLSDADAIRRTIQAIRPDLIINPAAYTAVDKAESEQDLAYAINAIAPQILAEEAAKINAALIHFSTDYVYDGTKTRDYVETDDVNPLSIYGKSKLAGEAAIQAVGLPHLILRTSWVYGAYGKNFLKTIIRLASERDNLRIVADQFGAPTSSDSIADAVLALLTAWQPQNSHQTGIYHLSNQGKTSWHGFSCEIVNQYNALLADKDWPALKANVDSIAAITTADYPTPAARPAHSCLNNSKLKEVFGIELPCWQAALQQVMRDLTI